MILYLQHLEIKFIKVSL